MVFVYLNWFQVWICAYQLRSIFPDENQSQVDLEKRLTPEPGNTKGSKGNGKRSGVICLTNGKIVSILYITDIKYFVYRLLMFKRLMITLLKDWSGKIEVGCQQVSKLVCNSAFFLFMDQYTKLPSDIKE